MCNVYALAASPYFTNAPKQDPVDEESKATLPDPDPDDVVLNASYDAYLGQGAGGENDCDANDRDDLEEDEDQEDTTFHEKIQKDLKHLIDEIGSNAGMKPQSLNNDPVRREAEEKEVILRQVRNWFGMNLN